MELRLLLDENVERDLASYLEKAGHDVQRVVDVEALGPESDDDEVVAFARERDRLVLTYDEDFVDPDVADRHAGVLYVPNQHCPPLTCFRIVEAVAEAYPDRDALPPVVFLTEEWLSER